MDVPPPPGRHALPAGVTTSNLLGVDYWHVKTGDGGDLYATQFGLPFLDQLRPENWYEPAWFTNNREKLAGSSTVYKVATRPLRNRQLDIVVKWCRVGEQVPFDTLTLNKFAEAEFNSPYEEFALVMEMRNCKDPGIIRTHKPLAIYVPAEKLQLWQTGRHESKMAQKKARHRDVELDIYRQYILIYEWIKGAAIVEMLQQTDIGRDQYPRIMAQMTEKAMAELAARGFRVVDMKPAHIIVRTDDKGDLLRQDGQIAYALVDFELLDRTPEHEEEVVRARRSSYLRKQRDRFHPERPDAFPPHLQATTIFGVDYVVGHTESTQGMLWVAGKDPGLFDYFLPERWRRTKRRKLSQANDVYFTRTKDNINIVWKVSRVGERPDGDSADPVMRRRMEYGFNSPFEEFALALELAREGVNTVYPRAIYMTGLESETAEYIEDSSRFDSHAEWQTPEGQPVLRPNHNYITVWGFWNGRDELLAEPNPTYCEGINLQLACHAGYLSESDGEALLAGVKTRLQTLGIEDLNLKRDHLLLSLTAEGCLIRGVDGIPELRYCNFELMSFRRDRLIRGEPGGL